MTAWMHPNVNNAGFSVFKNPFYVEGNAFSMFVRPQGYAQYVLVRNMECKQQGAFKQVYPGLQGVSISESL